MEALEIDNTRLAANILMVEAELKRVKKELERAERVMMTEQILDNMMDTLSESYREEIQRQRDGNPEDSSKRSMLEAINLRRLTHVIISETKSGRLLSYYFIDDSEMLSDLEKRLSETPVWRGGGGIHPFYLDPPPVTRIILVDERMHAYELRADGYDLYQKKEDVPNSWFGQWIANAKKSNDDIVIQSRKD